MARQFLTGLNLNQNELLNARIQNLETDPTPAVAGQIYYNTASSVLKYYTGSEWLTLAQGGSVEDAINTAINLLTTADIEEDPNATTTSGTMYFTDQRAKDAAAALITGATKTNITITGDGDGLTITAENGVADSTTTDLAEGTNLYFTDERAQDAVGNSVGTGLTYNDTTGAVSLKFNQNAGAIGIDGSGNVKVNVDGTTIDTAGSGSFLRVLTGETSTVASKTYADGAASSAVTNHNNETSGVHGVTGNVVGDTDSQTLTNKTLGSGTVLSANVDADENKIVDLAEPTDAQDAATKNYVDTELGDHSDATTGVHGVTGDVVGTENTQTLTNKALGTNSSLSADLDANNNKITGLAAPTDANDAATKGYVDSVAEGLHVHASVRAATTENIDVLGIGIGSLDGVALFDGDRVLVKDQTDPSENGIYVHNARELTRAVDYDTATEIQAGDFVFVDGGNTYANTGWVQTNPVATLGTDDIEWVQFSGAGTFTAGDGLTIDGTEFNVVGTADRITVNSDSVDIASTYAGQTSIDTVGTLTTGTWEADTIAVEYGGTGATTAAGARENLGATTKYTAANPELLESAGAITWVVTHNMGIRTVLVQIYTLDDFEEVEVDVERTNTNVVTLRWVSATDVSANSYQVVIVG